MRFLILGAGRIGYAIAYDLLRSRNQNQVVLVDIDQTRLDHVKSELANERLAIVRADVSDLDELSYLISGANVVISCSTNKYNYELAKAALEVGAHFCDLGGNEDIVRRQFLLDEMARENNVAIIPDCGLVPGLASILVAAACERLDEFTEIRLRVGTLPVEPRPPLNYSLFGSVEKLISEYVEDATVIRGGRLLRVQSLQDIEEIEFPSPFGKLEAFNTSGGTSTLTTTFGDRVTHLDYKTIRYPGHCAMVRLLKDLGLMEIKGLRLGQQQVRPRAILATLLEQKLPKNDPDVVLLRVSVDGIKDGEATEITWEAVDYMDEETGLSAVQRTTAFPVSIIAQMVATGEIESRGTLTQETCIPTERFISEMIKRGVQLAASERRPATAGS
jgi:lysine 6-dehydrogenase